MTYLLDSYEEHLFRPSNRPFFALVEVASEIWQSQAVKLWRATRNWRLPLQCRISDPL